eukprot:gene17099-23531_t
MSGMSVILSLLFFLCLLIPISSHPSIFFKRHYGKKHAFCGLCYLLILIYGIVEISLQSHGFNFLNSNNHIMVYDIALGIMGIILTSTAAIEFHHNNVKNTASGTLDEHATVTNNEMIEHAFYQYLNLVQIFYFHINSLQIESTLFLRLISVLMIPTLPWLYRSNFPVHSFSDNYNKVDKKSNGFVRLLYRIKKYQYVFYKHFLYHGLNITLGLCGSIGISPSNKPFVFEPTFRTYWILLNTSYVMEFFLQTLVKKEFISQYFMLFMQQILMVASSIAALK